MLSINKMLVARTRLKESGMKNYRRITTRLGLAIAAALLLINSADAQENKALRPVFYIEDQDLARFATAVSFVFSLQNENAFLQQAPDTANFIFISASGLIIDRTIQEDYLDMFAVGVIRDIVEFKSDSDECFIQEFTSNTGRSFVLAVNESGNGPLTIDRKCFLLALSYFDSFQFAGKKEFDELSIEEVTLAVLERLRN